MLESQAQQGREMSQTFEDQAERAPSFPFVAGALGSIALSAGLMLTGRREVATFVGQWVPTLLLIGIFNKLLRIENQRSLGAAPGAGVH
jgi:hypothetical protein